MNTFLYIHPRNSNLWKFLIKKLQKLKNRCPLKDTKCWDLKFENDETPSDLNQKKHYQSLFIQKNQDTEIRISFEQGHGLYGEVSILKKDFHPLFLELIETDYSASCLYKYFDETVHFELFSFESKPDLCFYFEPSNKKPCGPVQILDMARTIINGLKLEEAKILCTQKQQSFTSVIDQELIEKVYHPQQIQKWSNVGFDPF